MDGKISITYRHFDRSEASGEIFGNVIINSLFKRFLDYARNDDRLKQTVKFKPYKPSKYLIFTINY